MAMNITAQHAYKMHTMPDRLGHPYGPNELPIVYYDTEYS